jgi:hypothetical protein
VRLRCGEVDARHGGARWIYRRAREGRGGHGGGIMWLGSGRVGGCVSLEWVIQLVAVAVAVVSMRVSFLFVRAMHVFRSVC